MKQALKPLKPSTFRVIALALILFLVFVAIFVRMYTMVISNSETYAERASTKSTKTITVYGKRGTIYDTNMVPFAYDETSYNVTFYRDPTKSEEEDRANYTQVLIDVITLIESNGKTTVNDFWLKKDENGVWRFNSGSSSEYVETRREASWRENFYMKTVPEEELWDTLLEKYCIPEDLSEEMTVKVLALWQESRMNAFNSMPVPIAYNVGFETVSEIESKSMELDGVDIEESSSRVYPQGAVASHVVGYIGRINSTQLETYRSQGYPNDAFIGQAGIEYSLEDQLTPYIQYRQGSREVEINTRGKVVRELSYDPPTDGNSVVLTIDLDLEKKMKEALLDNIATIRAEQEARIARDSWQKTNEEVLARYEEQDREIALAESGAIVAMNPNTGEVLGMISYPDYDLTMFNGGEVNNSMWNELLDLNDPLYNRAISTRDTPGSIFKLCTALAALSEGATTIDETIDDMGSYTQTNSTNPAKCWVSAAERYKHQDQTVVEAIKNSCNYYFYTVSHRMGIDKLYSWAAKLGLTTKTNIELPGETTSFVGNQQMLYDPERDVEDQYTSKPMLAAQAIREELEQVAIDRNTEFDEAVLDNAVLSFLKIAISYKSTSDWYAPIREVLQYDLGIPQTYISNHFMVNTFVTYLRDIFWVENETIMCGIGQSITQLTPIAVARYVSAIANNGIVYDAQIVDKIIAADGTVVLEKEPVIANRIETESIYFEKIREGMEDVTSMEDGGTAGKYFENAQHTIAAKTGTSERTDLDVENNAWLVSYAPIDDPQIVVVVYIPNGYSGAMASPAAVEVIDYYLNKLDDVENTQVPSEFSVAD
ncbi:MAG: hypothetical protein IJ466_04315 [Clostridia bacterium]|nr:hypothetical protein [Clostridia bacterium]